VIDTGASSPPVIGRLVATGLHDELAGETYAVIDGTDGRAHRVRFRGIEAFAHAPSEGPWVYNFCNRTARPLALYIQVDRRESSSDRPGLVGEMPGTKFIGKYLKMAPKPFGLG
jgi:Protein of unknown function (DUF3363)